MASDTPASGCGPEAQREQWKQVREHIHRAEQRLLDLQFDYQQKVNAVEALKLDLRQTTKDSQDCEATSLSLGRATLEAFKKRQDYELQWRALEQDRVMLAQQLLQEQEGLTADQKAFDEKQAFYQQHLQEQQEHVAKLQRALQASTAAADADAADAAGMDVEPRHVAYHAVHASSGEGAAVQLADDDLQAPTDQQMQAA
ncbi:hypothetical protein OEZ86_000974 [Tetradesmus obliquus]|nr:hypothetical protein OEZ86_000974 [Tetradesmus obliquus]